jgi:hypothetical protein
MRRILILGALCIVVWFVWPRSPLTRHFSRPLPSSARLDHHSHRHSGFSDNCYAFRFTVTDDALRDKLIADWKLTKVTDPKSNAGGFVALDPPSWWPVERLRSLPERYENDDVADERYWAIWIDKENGWLYANHGNW